MKDKFKRYLKSAGMTQADFAKASRTPIDTVRGWCCGRSEVRGSALMLAWVMMKHPDIKEELMK